jgi:hypothetical protein
MYDFWLGEVHTEAYPTKERNPAANRRLELIEAGHRHSRHDRIRITESLLSEQLALGQHMDRHQGNHRQL